jgi:hypothetical protein
MALSGGLIEVGMKFLLGAGVLLMLLVAPAFGQWKVVKVTASGPEKDPPGLLTDLWLKIELKNDSKETLYVPGLWGKWYMIESYIKEADGQVWERQNTGVDQNLEMTAVAPGATIDAGGRFKREHVGRLMLLTLVVAKVKGNETGSRILVGPFTIPAPAEKKGAGEAGKK